MAASNLDLTPDWNQEKDSILGESAAITLRIFIEDKGKQTSMRFDPALYVAQVCKLINEKHDVGNIQDHGLYHKVPDPTKCRWLSAKRTLRYYDLHNLDEIEFKKKHRRLGVMFMDGARRIVMVDDSAVVQDIVRVVGDKFDIPQPEEFSLKLPESDDADWLNPHQTLAEQGVPPDQDVLFKKKYFFFDANVDTNDLVTLNLLYEQIKDDVVNTRLPITEQEAVDLAAFQCQLVLGIHDPAKHKPGKKLGVKDMLPPEYRKSKHIDRRIFRAHQQLGNMNSHDAKFRFIQYARTLETYGVTPFLVKEPAKDKRGNKKKKFTPILLGVSRDAIHRLDPVTKRPVAEPMILTTLRRWAPAKNSLTLDFGDHMDSYYTVITDEGDAIAELIAGYIDIIMNQRKDKAKNFDEEEQVAIEEDLGGSMAASAVTTTKSRHRRIKTQRVAAAGTVSQPQSAQAVSSNQLRSNIQSALATISSASIDADAPQLAPANNERERLRNLQSARDMLADVLGDLGMAAADTVQAAASNDPNNKNALVNNARRMAALAANLAGTAKLNAEYADDPDAVRRAADDANDKISKLLALATGAALEDGTGLDDLLRASAELGAALNGMLGATGAADANPLSLDALLAASNALNDAMLGLLGAANEVSLGDANKDQQLASASLRLREQADRLTGGVKSAGGSVLQPRVRANLKASGANLDGDTQKMLELAQMLGISDPDMDRLREAAMALDSALNNMYDKLDNAGKFADRTEELAGAAGEVDAALGALIDAEDPAERDAAMRNVSKLTTRLANLAQLEGDAEPDQELRDQLLESARILAAALEALKGSVDDAREADNDEASRDEVVNRVNDLSVTMADMINKRRQKRALQDLANAAKYNADMTFALAETLEDAGENRNTSAKLKADRAAGTAVSKNEDLVLAARVYQARPANVDYQKDLLQAVKGVTGPSSRLILAAKGCAPGFDDTGEDMVKVASQDAAAAHKFLLEAIADARSACWTLDVEQALDKIREARSDLTVTAGEVVAGTLDEPEFGVTQATAQDEMVDISESLQDTIDQIKQVVRSVDPDGLALATKDAASHMTMLSGSARGIAQTTDDNDTKLNVVASAQGLADALDALVVASKAAMEHGADEASLRVLEAKAQEAQSGLNQVLGTLPGAGDCINARAQIMVLARDVDVENLPDPDEGETFGSYNDRLRAAARALTNALQRLPHAATGSPDDLGAAAKRVGTAMPAVLDAGTGAAASTSLPSAKHAIVGALKTLADDVGNSLEQARVVGSDPDDLEAPRQLTDAVNDANDSIANLLAALNAATPGQEDCDEAAARINESMGKLELSMLPLDPTGTFGENLDLLLAAAQALSDATSGLAQAARTNPNNVGAGADASARFTDRVVDVSANTAALVVGNAKFNPKQFSGDVDKILYAISQLAAPGNSAKQIVKGASTVARASSGLASKAKKSARSIEDEGAKASITAVANNINGATAELVNAAKAAAPAPEDPTALEALAAAGEGVKTSVLRLLSLAEDLAGDGDSNAHESQQELLDAARSVANAVSTLVGSSKVLVGAPDDRASQRLVSSSQREVDDSISQLIKTAKSAAPGQKECDAAIDDINNAINLLDNSVMAASVGDLQPAAGLTRESCKTGIIAVMKTLSKAVKAIGPAAKRDPKALGVAASKIGGSMQKFVKFSEGAAANTSDTDKSQAILASAQTVTNDLIPLLNHCKASGGAPRPEHEQGITDGQIQVISDVKALLQQISSESTSSQDLDSAIGTIDESMEFLEGPPRPTPGMAYGGYQEQIFQRGKTLAQALARLANATKRDPSAIGESARDAADVFPKMFVTARNASEFSSRPDELLDASRAVGEQTKALIELAKQVQDDPSNTELQQQVTRLSGGPVAKSISSLFAVAKAPATGERDTEEAINTIDTATNDIATAELMANTGQLSTDAEGTYEDHKDDLIKMARAMAAQISKLVSSGTGSSEDVAGNAKKVALVASKIAESSIAGAGSLQEANVQITVLTAARAVTEAVSQTVTDVLAMNADKTNRDLQKTVKSNVKISAQAIQGLVSTASNAVAEANRGARALDTAVVELRQGADQMESDAPATGESTPDDVAEGARRAAASTAKLLLAAKQGQSEVAAVSTEVTRVILDLLVMCKNASTMEGVTDQVKGSFFRSARNVVEQNCTLFETLSAAGGTTKNNKQAHKQLMGQSKRVADAVADLVSSSALLESGGVDENDPNYIAETELLAAAEEIELQQKALEELKPKRSEVRGELSFDEQVVEACMAIASCTSALVKAATVAQKDIVKNERHAQGELYAPDTTFSSGLISAAQAVSAECGQLVQQAELLCQEQLETPALVIEAAARGVASATVHLVTASTVKGDPHWKSQQRLKKAAKTVAGATQTLVEITNALTQRQQAAAAAAAGVTEGGPAGEDDDDEDIDGGMGNVTANREMMEARLKMLRLQNELDQARTAMAGIHKKRYKKKKNKAGE